MSGPVAKEETLEEIAERIAATLPQRSKQAYGFEWVKSEILSALRNERERAARIIKEHRESDVCKDNCWTTITNQILGE